MAIQTGYQGTAKRIGNGVVNDDPAVFRMYAEMAGDLGNRLSATPRGAKHAFAVKVLHALTLTEKSLGYLPYHLQQLQEEAAKLAPDYDPEYDC